MSQARGNLFERFVIQQLLRFATGEVPHRFDTGTVKQDGWDDAAQTIAMSF